MKKIIFIVLIILLIISLASGCKYNKATDYETEPFDPTDPEYAQVVDNYSETDTAEEADNQNKT